MAATFGSIFTLDYEIHGNGDGDPMELMVEPTARMLKQFDKYGAKLTIMADVGEILKFKEFYEETGRDEFHYLAICDQLKEAMATGHDVQLHIHSSYFKSKYENGHWIQNWSEYSMAELGYDRLVEIIAESKTFLVDLLRPVNPNYECFAFRAANWSMMPSKNITRALLANGITIETSVFKYGYRDGFVKFNYADAHSELLPWSIDEENINKKDPNGDLLEIPIYCENKRAWTFITPTRLYRVLQASQHKHPEHMYGVDEKQQEYMQQEQKPKKSKLSRLTGLFTDKHAWKLDFNQCTGGQMKSVFKKVHKKYGHLNTDIPVVSIGHSKIFTKMNERSLEPFLKFVAENPEKYSFTTFGDYEVEKLKAVG